MPPGQPVRGGLDAAGGVRPARPGVGLFVEEVVVSPGNAIVRYTIPMPEDSRIPGMDAEEVAPTSPVLSTVRSGGLGGDRTHDQGIMSPLL